MDEIRSFMAERLSPFRLKGLRAIFILPDDDVIEDKVGSLLCALQFVCTVLELNGVLILKVLHKLEN